MNKNLFRIIFNKRRGQLMAVAESTASQGKVAGGETPASAGADASDQADLALGALSLAMLCALGGVLWALPMPRAHAQVGAYRNAPGNQQPTILQTANGVPQINIQSPNAAGVSRNVYSQFDVQSRGVILNNSRIPVLTQQGGWVQANPWLATGSARVILNEVNATTPSQLNGYVEVGGQRAEVVIANPAGISVNGGGFVNTSKAILTTGAPVLNSGRLDGYRVQGGAISIHGNGLDLSTTDYAALLARAVQVNAGIWANELKVVTGANAIDAASLSANTLPVASPSAGTGAVPSFALDVAQLGGMYAGKIHLIGTELGLGVRSAGVLSSMGSAAAGDLVLQNNGWLTNTGAIQAGANLLITTEGGITNSGAIAAQGNTKITANSLSSNAAGLVAAGIQSNGSLIAPVTASLGNLDIATTQGIAVNGQTLAANTVTYTGSSVDLSGSQTSAAHITVTANSGNVTTSNATLATFGSAGVLAITAKANNAQTLDNAQGVLRAGQLNLEVANFSNIQGSVYAHQDLSLVATGAITNTGFIAAQGNATLNTSATLTNSGKLQAGNTLNLAANHFDNTALGEVSGNTTQLNVTRTLTNRGLIDGLDAQVNAETVNNIGTGRIYGDHLSVAAVNLRNDTETLTGVTQAATLAARDRLDLGVSGTVTNREHALIYSVGDMAIGGALDATRRATGSATTLNNNSAAIEAGRHLSLASATVNNTNDHFTTRIDQVAGPTAKNWLVGQWHVDHETSTYNTVVNEYETKVASSDPAQILAGGNILIRGQNLTNDKSKIIAGGSLTGDLVNLNNIQAVGEHRLTESGEVTVTTHHWSGGAFGRGNYWTSLTTDYNPADVVTSITLPVTYVLDKTSPTGTGSANSGWVNGSVQARSTNVSEPPTGAARQSANQTPSDRGAHPNTTLPTSSLFKTNPSLTSAYLVETDPRFIDRKTWLGSDYITQSIGLDPTVTQKRLGDGYYEQKLIREQVAELTGRRFLADYTSDEQEYKALMNSAITFAQTYNLLPGIALTAQQMAQLTSDIVWLVEQTVSLPDGSSQKVLVPQLYVKVQPGDIDASGALLAGKEVNLRLTGDLTNSGTIAALGNVAGRNVVSLTAANVNNLGGRIGGDDVSVTAQRDLNNIGGSIAAVNSFKAVAGRDLTVQTTTQSAVNAMASRTRIERVAGLYVSGSSGALLASAGRDLSVVAGVVSNAGNGSTLLGAGNNLTLAAAKTSQQLNIVWDANNYSKSSSSTDVGSTVTGGGNTQLNAGQTLLATAANVQAAGALGVTAATINLQAGQATQASDEARQSTSKGVMSSTTVVTKDTRSSVTAVGSNLGGDTVALLAGQDITLKGSNVVSNNGTQLAAGGNVNIQAAQNTSTSSSFRKETSSGLMSGGGLSISFGKQQQSLDEKATTTTAAASTVGSVAGNIAITAGNQYQQVGSDVLAPKGNIDITAKAVTIQDARETNAQSTEQKFEQSGVTLALNSAVISTVQNAQNQLKAASQTSDARMKTLASASAAANVKMAADALKGTEIASANAADKVGGISLSLSYGQSSSQSRQNAQSDTARGSNVQAGGQVNIAATGGGERSNLIVQGSDISGQQVSLAADQQVAFLAASNNSSQSNSSSNKSASVGGAAQLGNSGGGVGVTGSISAGSGSGNGADTIYTNTHIKSTDNVRIKSAVDTTLKGATVVGKQVTATVGGNLNIESLQDTSTYADKNQQAGISALVGAGASGSGNANFTKSNINSNYASVNEQSAIKAGDGGFAVNVQGNTDLKGGAITSTQAAIDNNKNTFATGGSLTTSDIQNKASYDARSAGASIGAGSSPLPGQGLSANLSGAGIGKDSGNLSSTTTAGISGIAGDSGKRTGDNAQGIGKIFDADKVRQEIQAQTQITQEFGKNASKAVGDYAQTKLDEAKKNNDQAGIDAWKEGGSARVALHTVVGGLTFGGQGALGAGTSQAAVDQIGQAIKETNLPAELKQTLVAVAGTAIGAATGGTAGVVTAFNATVNNYLLHNKLVDEEGELLRLKQKKQTGQCDISCDTRIGELQTKDNLRDEQVAPLIDACEKAGRNNCKGEVIAKQFAEANGFGSESMKRESNPGTAGSPFSFNNCTAGDKGGCSFGPLQIAANTGLMMTFITELGKNPAPEAQSFYQKLQAAGGLSAAQSGDQAFVSTWMRLTSKDPQFVQYQIDTLVNQNLYPVVQELQKSGVDFNSLSQVQKEALFSAAVQHGAGTVSKTKGADNVLERAISVAQTDAQAPTFPTYTRQDLVYGQVEDQMRAAEEAKAKLTSQQLQLTSQQLQLEKVKNQILEQGLGADALQIQLIQSQVNTLDLKISDINKQVNGVTHKLDEQNQYIQQAGQYLKEQARAALDNPEQFIRDFYKARTEMYPSEAKRYQLEMESLLKQYQQEQTQKGVK